MSSIIGVIGTILGVFTGYLLKEITSIGKVKLYITDFSLQYLHRGSNGEVLHDSSFLIKSYKGLRVYLEVDFYNTSGKNQIIRNLTSKITIKDHEIKGDLSDTDTQREVRTETLFDTVRSFSIPQYGISSKRLLFFSNEQINVDLKDAIYQLIYLNNKNKLKNNKIDITQFENKTLDNTGAE